MQEKPPSGRRGRPVAQDLPARRERLIEVAAEIFTREGYDQATFARIAREAGVSIKTIYAWFDGKIGLFRAVTNHFAQQIEPAAQAILHPGALPQEALPRAAELVLSFALSPPLLAFQRAVIGASADVPEIGGEYNRNGPMRGYAVLGRYFAHCDQAGLLRVPDLQQSIDLFLGLIWGDQFRFRLLDAEAPPLSAAAIRERAQRGAALFIKLHEVG